VNTDIHTPLSADQVAEAARDSARRTADAARETARKATVVAKDAAAAAKDAALGISDKAEEMYHSAAVKAEATLEISKDYVRRNPVPVVLGAIAFGAALGYMLMSARRKPTFGERYADEPLATVRDAFLGALVPVTQRVHEGYDFARNGAGKAIDSVHRFGSGPAGHSFSDHIGRIGNNLKFW